VHASGDGVGHRVSIPLDVGDLVAVAVVAPVGALEAAQVGSRLVRRDGAFLVPRDGRCVVVEGGECTFPQVEGDVI